MSRESKAHFGLPWLRPWDNRGKRYMDRKRIKCPLNALQLVPIYLQPIPWHSENLVENCNFFIPSLHLTPPYVVAPRTIAKMSHGWQEGSTLVKRIVPSILIRFPVIQPVSTKVCQLSTCFAHFGLPLVCQWDNRDKCYKDWKRIQWGSNASRHVPICLQPFPSN